MMDNIQLRRLSIPIITGAGQYNTTQRESVKSERLEQTSFGQMLEQTIQQEVEFSNHATNRVKEREVELTPKDLERLNQGVSLAKEKGLNQTLILIDKNAFVVSAKNNKVITTVSGSELQANVFTNIEGTVII